MNPVFKILLRLLFTILFVGEMGYELNRFEGDVDEELVCPICSGVLEEPLQVRSLTLSILMNYSTWIHTMNLG